MKNVLVFVAQRAVSHARAMDRERMHILKKATKHMNKCYNCQFPILNDVQHAVTCECKGPCETILFCQQTERCRIRERKEILECDYCQTRCLAEHESNYDWCGSCKRLLCPSCSSACSVCAKTVCDDASDGCYSICDACNSHLCTHCEKDSYHDCENCDTLCNGKRHDCH
jgi:hypothetical protein